MKSVSLLHRIVVLSLVFAFAGWGVGFAQQPDSETAQVAPHQKAELSENLPGTIDTTPPPATKSEEAIKLRNAGLEEALDGKFLIALNNLRKAEKLNPEDKTTDSAVELLEEYLKRMAKVRSEREREYQYEVDRIRWAYLAEKHIPELEKKPFIKDFRRTIRKELTEAYNAIGTAESFEDASVEEAVKMKTAALGEIAKATNALRKAVAFLESEQDEYAQEFRSEAEKCQTHLDVAMKIWSTIDPSSLRGRWEGAGRIRAVENDLADAVTDLEVMVAKKPWRIALLHGRVAMQITPDKDKLVQSQWYRNMVKDAEERGRNAIADAKWYDALRAYLALEALDPKNEAYKAEVKKVRRHVRVLRLYGKEKDEEDTVAWLDGKTVPKNGVEQKKPPEKQEKTGDEQEEESDGEGPKDSIEPIWREIIAGVDVEMVRKAISKLGDSYVKNVDYRKLTRGALESVKILVQTPQVTETFPALKDDSKRKAFVAAIDKELKDLDRNDRVDHIRLIGVLNNLIYHSEETVDIPIGVLAVEFTDGFLEELDKFSSMIWPYDVPNFYKQTMGHFTGIGVRITKEPNKPLKVVTPLLDTPAYKAKIRAGDLIMKVDGVSTANKTIDKLVKRIMGPTGSTVVLTIKRRGVPKPFEVSVVRKAVRIRTVKGWQRRPDGEWGYLLNGGRKIGYIRIRQFTGTTRTTIHKALRSLKEQGVSSLVLDLRSNPGGLLRSATRVANEFLATGRIVYTRGRQVPRNEIKANKKGTYLQGDLVVLMDEQSASAAEILSGALKDWDRGVIVGQRSYGKGSVQNVIPVRRDEALLKLTTAYYYLPSGRLLHRQNNAEGWGVDPDVEVYVTPRQRLRWLQIRQKTDLLQDFDPELLKADLAQMYDADIQLNTAVLLLELMRLKRQTESAKWVASES